MRTLNILLLASVLFVSASVVYAAQVSDTVLVATDKTTIQSEVVTPAVVDLVAGSKVAQSKKVQALVASTSLTISEAVKESLVQERQDITNQRLALIITLLNKIEKNTR